MIKSLKTIKSLRVLATKKVTAVSLYNFRSLEEVEEYVKSLKQEFNEDNKKFDALKKVLAFSHSITAAINIRQLKTTKPSNKIEFIKPDMSKLTKAFSVVDKYQDKIESLDSVINTLTLTFKGEKGAPSTLKELKSLRSTIKTKLDVAYKFLSDLGNNHEPESFKKIVNTIVDKVKRAFVKSFSSIKQTVYMIPQDDNTILISHYIEFKDFKDNNDYIHESYFLIVSALINTETLATSYFVNALQSYASPNKAGKGIKVDDGNEALVQALILLEHAGFSSLMDKTVIPTSQDKLNKINWNIPKDWLQEIKIENDNDIITVVFTKLVTDKNLQEAINHFTVDLKTAIIPNDYRMGIKNKKFTVPELDSKGQHTKQKLNAAHFIFTLPDVHQRKELKLDANKVRQLKEMFGMGDKQAGDLIKMFNSI